MLVKILTMSDTTFAVAKSGRLVLPRAQVERCLADLLRLGGVAVTADASKPSASLRMSSQLCLYDASGRVWPVTLKTWQNAVSGQLKPTYILENTADFIRATGAVQGDALALGADASGTRLTALLTKSNAIAANGSPLVTAAAAEASKTPKKRPSSRQSAAAPKTPAPRPRGGVCKPRAGRKVPPRLPVASEEITAAANILVDMLSNSSSDSISGTDGRGATAAAAAAAASHLLSAPSCLLSAPSTGSVSKPPVSLIPLPHLMSQLWSASTPLRSSLPAAPPLMTLPSVEVSASWAAGLVDMLAIGSMPAALTVAVQAQR